MSLLARVSPLTRAVVVKRIDEIRSRKPALCNLVIEQGRDGDRLGSIQER
jgi:hypothetical protein